MKNKKKNNKPSARSFECKDIDSLDILAKITLSLSDKRILDVKLKEEKAKPKRECNADDDSSQPPAKMSNTTAKAASNPEAVAKIWELVNSAKIDINYACVGYTASGQVVLDYRHLIDLIVASGFSSIDAIVFIDELAFSTKKTKNSPIVMTDIHTAKILTEINKVDL